FATEITEAWRNNVTSIVRVGRLLRDAKKAHGRHGKWRETFKALDPPFDWNTGGRLMKIERHPVLGNSAHAHNLPPCWYTLSLLARLSEARVLELIANHLITPKMTRRDAEALVPKRGAGDQSNGSRAERKGDFVRDVLTNDVLTADERYLLLAMIWK